MIVKTKSLPAPVLAALASVGFARPDIEIKTALKTPIQNSCSGSGQRGYVVQLDLRTGEFHTLTGNWGGSNAYSSSLVDSSDDTIPLLPNVTVVIYGQQGGSRPVTASITVHDGTLMPAPCGHDDCSRIPGMAEACLAGSIAVLSPKQYWVLRAWTLKSGYRRKEAMEGNRYSSLGAIVSPMSSSELDVVLQELIDHGLMSRNKANAISLTIAGKNIVAQQRGR